MGIEKGMVHVYTGNGKGKTSAAFGMAMRALGNGLKALVVQFLKSDGKPSGESATLMGIDGAEVIRFADQRHPIFCIGGCDVAKLQRSIQEGFLLAAGKVKSGAYDLVVLDEINNCIKEGWLDTEAVLGLIKDKPAGVELVLTGRGCPEEIIAASDYVTEMLLVKHPAQKGVKARKGVEY
jgi:cob(I)alamin adenosyltransferase